jgi:hypothetical protein
LDELGVKYYKFLRRLHNIYRKTLNDSDIDALKMERGGELAVEYAMKINSGKSKAVSLVDQVYYTVQKSWKALHIIMCVLKKGDGGGGGE